MNIPGPQDGASWERFYEAYRSLVFVAAFRVLQDSSEAEDVVQSIFLKIWLRPQVFCGGSLEGWLTVVARNCALDRLRRRDREFFSAALPDLACRDIAYAVESAAIHAADVRFLRRIVSELTPNERVLLFASFFLQYSHRNIAESLALPLGTVKSRIRNLLLRLRRQVNSEFCTESNDKCRNPLRLPATKDNCSNENAYVANSREHQIRQPKRHYE